LTSADVIARLHAALDEYYSGGDAEALRELDARAFDEIWS
jgi:hypothetical protein